MVSSRATWSELHQKTEQKNCAKKAYLDEQLWRAEQGGVQKVKWVEQTWAAPVWQNQPHDHGSGAT